MPQQASLCFTIASIRPDRLAENYHPDRIWHKTRTVISLALPVWLPIIETQPSVWGRDQYGIVNNLLDEIAYRLAAFLNRYGIASINIGRDGYGDIDTLIRKPAAAFSHVWAADYADLCGPPHKNVLDNGHLFYLWCR